MKRDIVWQRRGRIVVTVSCVHTMGRLVLKGMRRLTLRRDKLRFEGAPFIVYTNIAALRLPIS